MYGKCAFWACTALIFAGCASRSTPVPEPTPLPDGTGAAPAKLQLEVSAQPSADAGRNAPEGSGRNTANLPAPQASSNRAAMEKIIKEQGKTTDKSTRSFFSFGPRDNRPSGLEGELNDVERSYVRDVKDRNARTERAAEEKVFGGMNPLRR